MEATESTQRPQAPLKVPAAAPLLVFSDMDGTFLDSNKRVSELSWRALDALAERGIGFVPCTGRPFSGIYPELIAHPAVGYVISSNGASVHRIDPADPRIETAVQIHAAPLSRDKALSVLRICQGLDVTFDVFGDGCNYLRRKEFDRLSEFVDDPFVLQSMIDTRVPVDEEPDATICRVGTLERVTMYWHDPADRDRILDGLQRIDGIDITRSYPTNIEVMEHGSSKGAALTWLCGHLGIDPARTAAFGDNLNDVEMLVASGAGFAVANAEEPVRAAAGRICASNDEDGVARAVFGLIGTACDQAAAKEHA